MINITDKKKCCGCSACVNSCPAKAICMKIDNEGFCYPSVNNTTCIGCNICETVCPIMNRQKFEKYHQKAFLFQNNFKNIRKKSTSGGFYESIGRYVIKNGGVVYGVILDESFIIKHTKVSRIDDLTKFSKSKYCQSDLGSIFLDVKKDLNVGKLVCFSGTPCQVAGLKSFLKKKYDNLILVDIMCHSVPSPLVFEKYKQHVLKKMNAKRITDIVFRDKSKYGYQYSMMTVKTDNGIYSEGIDTDQYLRAFFDDYSVRPSCSKCAFKTQNRVSDITMWDCYNVFQIDKSFDDNQGTTRLLIHSENGEKIVSRLQNCKVKEIPVDLAVEDVLEMKKSVKLNKNRNAFFSDLNSNIDVFDKYFPITLKVKLDSFFRKIFCRIGLYNYFKYKIRRMKGR